MEEGMKTIWLMLLMGSVLASAQNDPQTMELRLQSLESRVPAKPASQEDLDVLRETLNKKVEIDLTPLTELQKRVAVIERQPDWLKILLSFLGLSGVVGILKYIRYQIDKKIAQAWQTKEETLRRMVQEADLDQQIRRDDRVTILSDDGPSLREWLRQFGFCQVGLIEVDPRTDLPTELALDAPGLLVLAVSDQSWNEAFVGCYPKPLLCYWVEGRILTCYQDRVTFANSKITLYSRLMELARYMRQSVERNHSIQKR
jgi:hypothetical protein